MIFSEWLQQQLNSRRLTGAELARSRRDREGERVGSPAWLLARCSSLPLFTCAFDEEQTKNRQNGQKLLAPGFIDYCSRYCSSRVLVCLRAGRAPNRTWSPHPLDQVTWNTGPEAAARLDLPLHCVAANQFRWSKNDLL
jgi:hypothetical protein